MTLRHVLGGDNLGLQGRTPASFLDSGARHQAKPTTASDTADEFHPPTGGRASDHGVLGCTDTDAPTDRVCRRLPLRQARRSPTPSMHAPGWARHGAFRWDADTGISDYALPPASSSGAASDHSQSVTSGVPPSRSRHTVQRVALPVPRISTADDARNASEGILYNFVIFYIARDGHGEHIESRHPYTSGTERGTAG
jgi:hypothetical protein